MKLYLGIVDVAYSGGSPACVTTTGDVAVILEARYGIMEKFAELHGEEIADELAEVMAGKLEELLASGRPADRIFEEGSLSGVEELFRKMLDDRELDGKVEGVPTGAALRGVSHRLKRPYVKSNPPRPSFIDSGTYQSSMRVWVEE